MTNLTNVVSFYFVYNKVEEGFLKVKHQERRSERRRGLKVFKPKRMVFDCWGPAGVGEMKIFNESEVNDKALVREILTSLNIPGLNIQELEFVPQQTNQGGHVPDFCGAFSMKEHFDFLDTQYLP